MAGYLGKISAVVTANTTDFTRAIGSAREEMERFARSTRSSVNSYRLNFDTTTMDRTLTKLQLFRRTLQEAANQSISTGALDQLYEVVEDLAKPLIKVKNEIEGLGNSVQAQLYPAMERAQKGVQNLYAAIADGSTTLQAQSRNISELRRQIILLGNSTAVVKDLEGLGKRLDIRNAGATFVQPRAQESLRRSDSLRGEAAKLSPAVRSDPFFQTQADAAERNAARIATAAARVERYRASVATAPAGPARDRAVDRLTSAEATLDARVERQNQLNARMELGVAAGRLRDSVAAPRPQSDADGVAAATTRVEALRSALRSVRPDGAFDAYAASLATMADGAARAKDNTTLLRGELTKLNAAMDSADRLVAAQNNINAINRQSAGVGQRFADPRKETARMFTDARAELGPLGRGDEVDAAQRKNYLAEGIAPRLSGAKASISELAGEFQSQLMPKLKAAQAEMERLTSEKATPAIGEIRKLRTEIDGLEKDIAAADAASKKLSQFDSATAMNLQPRAIQDFQHDFQMLLNMSGQLNDNLGTQMAGNLQRSKQRAREIVIELAQIQAGPVTPASSSRRTQLLDEVRGMSRQLARELAQLDPTKFTEKQIERLLSANRRLRGDFDGMRSGAMRAQLGIQQLAFAVDDFMSATGGLEYKIRAVSNNLTQFAFVMGSTNGLVLGVAAVVGTQLLMQFTNLGKYSKESEERLKLLNDRLEKSRSLAEENTKAFKELGKSLRDAGGGGLMSGRNSIENAIEERRKAQKEQREASVAASSPRAVQAEAIAKRLEEELGKTESPARRAELRREIADARGRAKQAAEQAMIAPSMGDVGDALRRGQLARGRAADAQDPADLQAALSGVRNEIYRLTDQQNAPGAENAVIRFAARTFPEFADELVAGSKDKYARQELDAFRERDKRIAELEEMRASLDAKASEATSKALNDLATEILVSKGIIEGVYQDLSNLSVDKDVRGRIDADIFDQTKILEKALADAAKAQQEGRDFTPERAAADNAAAALERLYAQADKLSVEIALGSLRRSTSQVLEATTSGLPSGSSVVGTNAARLQVAMEMLSRERDRAVLKGDAAGVAEVDSDIARVRKFALGLEAASAAVVAFQRAAERAALNLAQVLTSEASSSEEQSRRRANRLSGDADLAGPSRADLESATRRRRDSEDFNRTIAQDLADERVRFEKELFTGGNPAGAILSGAVSRGRKIENDKSRSAAEQAAGKAAADEAQAQLDRMFEERPAVAAARQRVNQRDAVEQARLEDLRKRREAIGRQAEFVQSTAGSGQATALANGDLAQANRLREITFSLADAQRELSAAEAVGADNIGELQARVEELGQQARDTSASILEDTLKKKSDSKGGFNQLAEAERELQSAGVHGFSGGFNSMRANREELVRQRDRAQAAGLDDEAAALQGSIDELDNWAATVNASAIELASFTRAAQKAAMALQETVQGESQSAAVSARREANRQEALFGIGSPEADKARDRQKRLEAQAQAAEDERDRAQSEIENARNKFFQGSDQKRSAEIAELERQAEDANLSIKERDEARAKARQLRREQEREFEQRPEVRAERDRADKADRELQQIQSAERGRELMKTPLEKEREQIRENAADVGNAIKEIRGRDNQRAAARKFAASEAERVAPMFAQFRDEVLNSRLNPSRQAFSASDVQTSQGATELNRLLRGDDPNKNVNVVELRKQSRLLEDVVKAIKDSTGIVVDL